jgi:hypothetical protein
MVVGHALLRDEHLKEGRQEGGGVGVGVRVGVGARAGVGSTPNPSPYLLRPVDDKVAALVERAFPQLGEFRVAARVIDFGISKETCFELMSDHWNDFKAHPPLEDSYRLTRGTAFS